MTALLAILFSFIAPGAGHALTGHTTEACVLGVLFALGKTAFLPLSFRILKIRTLKSTLITFYVCNLFYIALIFYAAISAFWSGLQTHEIYFVHAILAAIMIITVYKNTKSKFIFFALCGRNGVYELLQQIHRSTTVKK